MKKILLVALIGLGTAVSSYTLLSGGKDRKTLAVGKEMPAQDSELIDLANKSKTIADFKGETGTLVIFSCNSCPFVVGSSNFVGWEVQYNDLQAKANDLGIGCVLVNSNEAKRDNGDNLADMVKRSSEKGYAMPYVLDNNHIFADAFGAKTTPHVFLFNAENTLVYEGQIDDSYNPTNTTITHFLENAMTQLNGGEKIVVNKTDAVGCSIKRVK